MIILLSPSKSLNENPESALPLTRPLFEEKTSQIARKLKTLSKPKIKALMSISDKLTVLNHQRFQSFNTDFAAEIGSAAIHTFNGDVFLGLQAQDFNTDDLLFAEDHLFILSGLYGLLKPSTQIQPYRLEMGSKLKVGRKENLYAFWDSTITEAINDAVAKQDKPVVINLASQEYSKAVQLKDITSPVLEIQFREWRNEKWQFVSFNAKKARGLMARYIIKNKLTEPEDLKGFDWEDYHYNRELSSDNQWFFTK
ncbi:peroxide stress protein YaaA [Membranihabitans marinus]|uniref:peroxide stress protein YaaA n=1 Tax=Membranihabitans marinus TaxID=1227546 RepID=UPI001F3A67F7|nr:peroxide stress protein YaaA [Membranihabitans marinus]